MHVSAIIPARYASSRFPGKAIACETGKPLVQHVYERALHAESVDSVLIATDDDRIEQAVRAFGGVCVRTRVDHPNGTSRLAEAVTTMSPTPDIVVNVQGDEPEIEPSLIDEAVASLNEHPDCAASTIASPVTDDADAENPNVVKVVIDQSGRALLFTRACVPFARSGAPQRLKHIGLYAYRTSFLAEYASLQPTPLEQAEQLEQLRILEHGRCIAVAISESATPTGIDTPEQYAAFVERWRSRQT